jgi:hypothetical protein
MSELNRLRSLGDQVVPPSFEVLRETARRRARGNVVAGSLAAAAVAVVVSVATLAVVNLDRTPPEPAGPPYPVSTEHPLAYALGATVHYGDRTVDAPEEIVELDVTDAGAVVRTADGRIWFTDGEALEQVGTLGDRGPALAEPDAPALVSWGFVVSDNVGTRAAWLEFPRPGEPELVVFDTETAEETARVSLGVEPGSYALLAGVTDRYGYWYSFSDVGEEPFPDQRVDLVSGATQDVSEEQYAADQPGPGTPRTMMISHADTSQGEPPNYRWTQPATMRQFDVRGGRVEPQGLYPFDARDGGTGERFEFDAPEGYPDAGPGWLVQWLDDDTVVIVQDRGADRDLLECRHSTGACTLTETLPGAAVLPEVNGPRSDRAPETESDDTDDRSLPNAVVPSGGRPLTFSDDWVADPDLDIHWRMKTVQYGDRTLNPGIDVTAMDLTVNGVVMVAPDGGVHFTDGETTEKVGESTIPYGSFVEWGVQTSTSGSLAAWFTPEGSDRSLVVYDTHDRRLLAEVPTPECRPDECNLVTVVGDRVYYEWSHAEGSRYSTRLMVLDVATETVSETDADALSEDLRSQPRGFVKGDNYQTGEVVTQDVNDEAVFFEARDSTLDLVRIVRGEGTDAPVFGYGGFDTTGRRLNLQLPKGYSPAEHPYALFQWIDDDRFAVMAGAADFVEPGVGYGDILVCDIARERCTLAAPGPEDGLRLVPHLVLPH